MKYLNNDIILNFAEIIPKMTTCLPAEHPNEIQSHRNDSRKDSGVFFDDDTMKNETFSMDNHPRKLPYPSSTSLTYHYNTHAHFIDSKMVDPSPSLYRPQFKLPTIKAITDSHIEKLDTQLAPIHSAPVSKKRFGSIKPSDDSHTCHFRGETGKVCGLSFRRPYDLSRHKNTHLKNRPFSYCEVCGKRFTRRDALRRHERVQGHTSKGQDMSKQLRQRLPQT